MSELQMRLKLSIESKRDKVKLDGLPLIGQWAVENIRQRIINEGITATGRTQRSLKYALLGEKGLQIIAESGDRAPISTLQYGREPGKQPPVDKLKEWIVAKRINYKSIAYKRKESKNWKPKYTPAERGLNSLAWAIAHKIKTSGTDRYKTNNINVYSPVLDEVIELFTNYIANETEKTVIEKLIK